MGSVDKIDTRLRREHYGKIKTESGTRSASRLSLVPVVRHIRYVHLFFQKIFYIHFQNKYKIAPRGKTPSGAILYYL